MPGRSVKREKNTESYCLLTGCLESRMEASRQGDTLGAAMGAATEAALSQMRCSPASWHRVPEPRQEHTVRHSET